MPSTLATVIRRPLTRGCRRDAGYLWMSFLSATLGGSFLVYTGLIAVALAFVLVGIPLAVLIAHVDRWFCMFDRSRAARVLGRPVAAKYTPPRGPGRISRWFSILGDRQTWLDAAWLLLSLLLATAGFLIAGILWTAALGLLSAPIWLWSIPGWIHRNVIWMSILFPFLAPLTAIAAAWFMRGWTLSYAMIAANLLAPGRERALEQRVRTLAETRAGAIDAAVSELRRVERDLHDGAQARLVALSMDLGLAEQRLAHDDRDAARAHLQSARGQARAAMADLRDLVRGIGPSILIDRGLDAALTALAAGRTPPVDLHVETRSTEVGARETAAYFVVAEAITNARKHAQATRVSVHVWENAAGLLVAEVVDDGIGGADEASGSGLAGLRQRVAALDGRLTVDSPSGGPTTVRAELPCAS
ncbi:MAG: sensor histidine kinase [Solirubrobacteraceae bacterium]